MYVILKNKNIWTFFAGIAAKMDEKHDLFGGELVLTYASSSDYHRISPNFDSNDFECTDHLRHQKHAGKWQMSTQMT